MVLHEMFMHVIEFPLLKTQTCTFSSSKKTKSNNNTFNILFFTSHKFHTSKPSTPQLCFFQPNFRSHFPPLFPGLSSTFGLHLGLCRLSNRQLLGCHRGTHADGHGTRADLRVTDPGRRSVTGVVWRWEEWGWWNLKEVKEVKQVYTSIPFFTSILPSCFHVFSCGKIQLKVLKMDVTAWWMCLLGDMLDFNMSKFLFWFIAPLKNWKWCQPSSTLTHLDDPWCRLSRL